MLITIYKTQEGRRYTGETENSWLTANYVHVSLNCASFQLWFRVQHVTRPIVKSHSQVVKWTKSASSLADAAFIILIQCYARSKLVQSKESYLARDGLSLTWQFHLKAFKVCRRCTNFARLPHLHAVNQYPAEIKEIKASALQTIFSNIRHRSQGLRGIQPTVFLLFLPYGILFIFSIPSFFFPVRWIVGGGLGVSPEDSQVINSSYKWVAHWCFVCLSALQCLLHRMTEISAEAF